jgi:ComF family protein
MPNAVRCGRCPISDPAYQRINGFFPYQGPVTSLIQTLKYNRGLYLEQDFRNLFNRLGEPLRNRLAGGLLTWVPLHPRKQRQRGFNQAEFLAKVLQSTLEPPDCQLQALLQRSTDTTTQTRLHISERLENVHEAFQTLPDVKACGRPVFVLDDVTTTGATLHACAAALRKKGFRHIEAIALCHG